MLTIACADSARVWRVSPSHCNCIRMFVVMCDRHSVSKGFCGTDPGNRRGDHRTWNPVEHIHFDGSLVYNPRFSIVDGWICVDRVKRCKVEGTLSGATGSLSVNASRYNGPSGTLEITAREDSITIKGILTRSTIPWWHQEGEIYWYENAKFNDCNVDVTYQPDAAGSVWISYTGVGTKSGMIRNEGFRLYISRYSFSAPVPRRQFSIDLVTFIARYPFARSMFLDALFTRLARSDGIMAKLTTKALTKVKAVDINSLAYLRDCKNLAEDAKKLVKIAKTIKKPKSWANAWLSYRYGLRLFVEDSSEIIEAIRRKKAHTRNGLVTYRAEVSDSEIGGITHLPIKIKGHCALRIGVLDIAEGHLAQTLRYLDLYPSFENLWDFVPYSFVIDWVLPVGEAFQRLDAKLDLVRYPLEDALGSLKITLRNTSPSPFSGYCTLTYYTRALYHKVDLSRLNWFAGLTFAGGLTVKHGIDFLCLTGQRVKTH